MVESIRNRGKDLFARENYRSAIATYQQATNVLTLSRPETEAQQKQLKDLKVKMFLNLAICYYKLEKPKYILKMLDRVDSIVDVNTLPKALFYYGRAYQMLSQTEKAINYFKSALKLEPKNKEIGETLFELDVQLKQSAEKEQLMWQKAFDSSASAPPKKKVKLTVDEDFEGEMREVCKYLAGSEGSDQVELPVGLSDDEVLYVKESATQYSKLTVAEEGIGEKRKVTIIKNP